MERFILKKLLDWKKNISNFLKLPRMFIAFTKSNSGKRSKDQTGKHPNYFYEVQNCPKSSILCHIVKW